MIENFFFLLFPISFTSLSFLPRYEYHWADGSTVKKPIKCSAPGEPAIGRSIISYFARSPFFEQPVPHLLHSLPSEYIDFLMTWVQVQLDDEALFPSKVCFSVTLSLLFLPCHSLQWNHHPTKSPRLEYHSRNTFSPWSRPFSSGFSVSTLTCITRISIAWWS